MEKGRERMKGKRNRKYINALWYESINILAISLSLHSFSTFLHCTSLLSFLSFHPLPSSIYFLYLTSSIYFLYFNSSLPIYFPSSLNPFTTFSFVHVYLHSGQSSFWKSVSVHFAALIKSVIVIFYRLLTCYTKHLKF